MPSYNRALLIGHLGQDPEIRYTPDGTPVVNSTLATSEKYKDRTGEKQEITTWVDVVFWRQRAELVSQYCQKGSCVLIEGRLREDKWQDSQGNSRKKIFVNCDNLTFLSNLKPRGEAAQGGSVDGGSSAPPQQAATEQAPPDDEIPF